MSFDFPLPKDEARNYGCLAFVSIKRLINGDDVESASGSPNSAYHMEQKLVHPPAKKKRLFSLYPSSPWVSSHSLPIYLSISLQPSTLSFHPFPNQKSRFPSSYLFLWLTKWKYSQHLNNRKSKDKFRTEYFCF